jgi:hypothetical protein
VPWPRQKSLAQAVAEYRKRALAREAKVAKRIRGLYRVTERKIQKDIKRLVAKIEAAHAAGLPIKESWLANLDASSELLRRLGAYIDEYSLAIGETVAGATKTAAIEGASHAAGLAKSAGVRAGFRRLNENQLIDLFGAMEAGSPLYDLFRDLGPRAVSKARTIFGEAAVQGQNPRVVARRLSSNIQNLTETRALLIARTETNRSYRGATLRSYRANSDVVTGWRWMSARNSRTCFVAGTPVLTSEGWKSIEDVAVGDHVLTHAGNWMPVEAVMSHSVDRTVEVHSPLGVVECTPDHPFLTTSLDWVDAEQLLGCVVVGIPERFAHDINAVSSRGRHEQSGINPHDSVAAGTESSVLDCIPIGLVPVGVVDFNDESVAHQEVNRFTNPSDLRLRRERQAERFESDARLSLWRRLAVVRQPAVAATEVIASVVDRRKDSHGLSTLGAGDDPRRAAAFLRAEPASDTPFKRLAASSASVLAVWSKWLAQWRTKPVRTGRARFDSELSPAGRAGLRHVVFRALEFVAPSRAKPGVTPNRRFKWLPASFATASYLRRRIALPVRADLLVRSVTTLAAEVLAVPRGMARRFKDGRAANMAFEFNGHIVFRVVPHNKQTRVYDIQVFEDCSFVAGGYVAHNCAVCLAMDGTVHQLSEDFASHPSCRCAAVPITEYSDPPGETGEEWFAKQPEELQRKILGPSKHSLYKTGTMSLSDLVEKTNHPRWGPGLTEASLKTLLGKLPKPAPSAPAQVPPQAPVPPTAQPKKPRKPRSSAPAPLPSTAPAPTPTKAPVPESSKLDIRKPRSGPKKAVAQQVLDIALPYIDATFANAPTTPTRVSLVSNIRGANGDFHRGTKFIRVSLSGNFGDPHGMALTTVHEWGHHLDNSLGAKYGSTWASGPAATPQALRWLTLVQNSESFIKLQVLSGRSRSEYFRRTQECFSRCMEMMMAKRLGGEVLRALDAKRAHWASDGYPAYWEWTEFEPILEAFEDWLRAEGVLQ